MKNKKILLFVGATVVSMVGAASCSNSTSVGGSNVIQIKSYKGGYGTDFLHEMADKFKTIYPEITFEFVEESALVNNEQAKLEICQPKKNQIDLYFTNGIDIEYLMEKNYTVLRDRDKTLLEPLDDVFNSKAIGFNGEESATIASRMFDGYKAAFTYDGSAAKWNGGIFALPWADSITGLFVNKSVLDKYEVALPLTSNELAEAVHKIYEQGASDDIYPFSWAGANAVGYWEYLFEVWFAQYTGKENFENFMRCDPNGSGKIKEEGYKVYEDIGILKALEGMDPILDLKYSPDGSVSMQHIEAQTDFMKGKSAFMCDGDWMLNEMKENYFELGKNITILRTPILSSIGTEIGLTDSQLHTLVEMIDNHKTKDEIKASLSMLDDAMIDRVIQARSMHDSIGSGHNVFMPSYADAKEAAKLFLRFMYSNDGCRIFRNFAYANLPLSYTPDPSDSNTPFQQSLDKVYDYEKPIIITSCAPYNNVRNIAQIFWFNYSAWVHPRTFLDIMKNKFSDGGTFTPEYVFNKEKEFVQSNWTKYMTNITYL